MGWNKIVINVNYQPADPGCRDSYTECTEIKRENLKIGNAICYNDPSGILPSIKVVDMDDKGITLATSETTVRLPNFSGNTCVKLAEDGRDYTNFQLWVILETFIDITHDLTFLRKFYTSYRVASLPKTDVEVLRNSDDPYGMFGYARWLVVTNPETGSLKRAEELFEKAIDGGCADAFMALSLMYDNGNMGVVNKSMAVSLRDGALERGSEWAALVYARNRMGGYNAEAEPKKVVEEIKHRIATEENLAPEWYDILGYAYEQLGDKDNAKKMYRKAIANNAVRAYSDLALLYYEEGDQKKYRKWMLEGISRGNGLCCVLDAGMVEKDFRKLPERQRISLHRVVKRRLNRGIKLGEGVCAYFMAYNYYRGAMGFKQDYEAAIQVATRGYALGDPSSCALIAEMSEKSGSKHECLRLDEGQMAFMRLEALRYGDESQLEAVVKAYRIGLYKGSLSEEVEREWLPQFKKKPQPNLAKDKMDPTVLIIYPDAYVEYQEVDINKFFFMDPFKEVGQLIDAADTRNVSVSQPLRDITKAVNFGKDKDLTMFYDIDAEKKGLKVNPVATKLNGGREMRGAVVIALEGDFHPMDCNDSGFRPYYSFTFFDDIVAVFDEIYDLMDGQLYSAEDLEDDDGRYDPYV